jgi:hypothetical protein
MNAKTVAGWILGGGLGITILGFAMQFWISLVVGSQLQAAGIVPESKVDALDVAVKENAKDIIRVESKAERIAQILMED